MSNQYRLMRAREVRAATGLSKSGLYRAISDGAFPRPVALNTGENARCVAWVEAEVLAWIESCERTRRGNDAVKNQPSDGRGHGER